MTVVGFSTVFPTPFGAGELDHGLAGVSLRPAEGVRTPAAARARPVATVPPPMVRLIGSTNRQGLLDALLGRSTEAREPEAEGPLARERLEASGRFLEGWLRYNGHDEARRRKGLAALEVVRAQLETEDVLFVLRNALVPV